MIIDQIHEKYPDDIILRADGLDEAVIGIDESKMRLVYSVSRVIEILERSMSREEAIEFFDYNIAGAYVGENTPVWCLDFF